MRSKLLSILFVLCSVHSFAAEELTVRLDIQSFENLKLNNPYIIIYESLLPVDTIQIWNTGNERFKLDLNKEYVIEVRQDCYIPTMVSISTIVPEGVKNGGALKVPVTIYPLFNQVKYTLFNIPLHHYAYNYVLGKFDEYKPYSQGIAGDLDVFLKSIKEQATKYVLFDKKKSSYVSDDDCERLLRIHARKARLIHSQLIAKRTNYIGEIDSSYYDAFIVTEKENRRSNVDIAKIEQEALLRKGRQEEEGRAGQQPIDIIQKVDLPVDIVNLEKEISGNKNVSVQDVIASEAIIQQKQAKISTLKEYNQLIKEEENIQQQYYEDVIYVVSKKKRLIEEIAEVKKEQKMFE